MRHIYHAEPLHRVCDAGGAGADDLGLQPATFADLERKGRHSCPRGFHTEDARADIDARLAPHDPSRSKAARQCLRTPVMLKFGGWKDSDRAVTPTAGRRVNIDRIVALRSEEHTSDLQSLMR